MQVGRIVANENDSSPYCCLRSPSWSSLSPARPKSERFRAIIQNDQEVAGRACRNKARAGRHFYHSNDALNALLSTTSRSLDSTSTVYQTPGNANDNATRTHFHTAASGINGGIVFGQMKDPNFETISTTLSSIRLPARSKVFGTTPKATARRCAMLSFNNLFAQSHAVISTSTRRITRAERFAASCSGAGAGNVDAADGLLAVLVGLSQRRR